MTTKRSSMFAPATRKALRLRLGIAGPPGCGKTFTALRIAAALGSKTAVLDTEHRSASKYVGLPNPDGGEFAFHVHELKDRSPRNFVRAMEDAVAAGFHTLILDSFSHEWAGILAHVDELKKVNSFTAWGEATPLHDSVIDTMLDADLHIIATLRSKMAYVLEANAKGKQVPRKVGLAPVQRDGVDYEFDLFGDMLESTLTISKSRCQLMPRGRVIHEPGAEMAAELLGWLETGTRHDPSWDDDRPGFCASLVDVPALGAIPSSERYPTLKAWCLHLGRPKPSDMTSEQRVNLRAYLDTEAGLERLVGWMG